MWHEKTSTRREEVEISKSSCKYQVAKANFIRSHTNLTALLQNSISQHIAKSITHLKWKSETCNYQLHSRLNCISCAVDRRRPECASSLSALAQFFRSCCWPLWWWWFVRCASEQFELDSLLSAICSGEISFFSRPIINLQQRKVIKNFPQSRLYVWQRAQCCDVSSHTGRDGDRISLSPRLRDRFVRWWFFYLA